MWPHSCHLSWLFQVYRIAMLDYVKNIKWLNSHGMLQSHFICILSINIFLASTDFWFVFQCSSKCFGIDFGSHISTICLYTTLKWSVCMYWAGSVIEINITIQMPCTLYIVHRTCTIERCKRDAGHIGIIKEKQKNDQWVPIEHENIISICMIPNTQWKYHSFANCTCNYRPYHITIPRRYEDCYK